MASGWAERSKTWTNEFEFGGDAAQNEPNGAGGDQLFPGFDLFPILNPLSEAPHPIHTTRLCKPIVDKVVDMS